MASGTITVGRDELERLRSPANLELLRRQAAGEEPDPVDVSELAAAGAGYAFGLEPLTLARLSYLYMIDSPFVLGAADGEAAVAGVITAAYVLATGGESMAPVIAATRIEAALGRCLETADTEARYSAYLDRVASAASARADFEIAAHEWWHRELGTAALEDVVGAIEQCIADAQTALLRLPAAAPGEEDEKKTI